MIAENVEQQVGRRIALARETLGLSQRAFAVKLGWPAGTLANYESGRRRLTIAQLAHIAAVLGRSPASFLVAAPTAALLLEWLGDDEPRARQAASFLASVDCSLAQRAATASPLNPYDVPADPARR